MPLSDTTPEYWYELTARDAESAEILRSGNGPAEICAYHYHQAAEKIIKGAILRCGKTFPFIHDLQRLYGILVLVAPEQQVLTDSIVKLQSVYSKFRYPRGDRLSNEDLNSIRQMYYSIEAALLH